MPLREFTDRSGVRWKVWDVQPEQLHPIIQALETEQGFLEGWLVFETADGLERRRLYPIPVRWSDGTVEKLDRLKDAAEPVRVHGERLRRSEIERARAERAEEVEEERLPPPPEKVADDEPPRELMRSFLYPRGRLWTVTEQRVVLKDEAGEPIATRTVLHFAAGARSMDLLAWPRNWASFGDEELAELLWLGFPREKSAANPTPYRRRKGDQPLEAPPAS